MFSIPDPYVFHPGSRILIKVYEYFSILFFKLSEIGFGIKNPDPNPGSESRILIFYTSRIPDPVVKKAPDPRSRTLLAATI
jgi:hypothetical protein